MRLLCTAALVSVFANPVHAQLTVEQRTHDFVNLAALYAKRYAPYEWKKQLYGFDLSERIKIGVFATMVTVFEVVTNCPEPSYIFSLAV
jgi:hypothetical protein